MIYDQRTRRFRDFTPQEKQAIHRKYAKQRDAELRRGPVTIEEMMDDDSADHNPQETWTPGESN
jgi:hypothetical protein